jgi:DNA invertase Pin-like site-specific DNA recombinase
MTASGPSGASGYDDTCSGSVTDRPGLASALDMLRDGYVLVVWKLDRIGHLLAHVVELVGTLQKRSVGLKVLTGGIETTNATGRPVCGIFATLSEFERNLILERTMAGLAAVGARGGTGCDSAWKKSPLGGVIGVQKGPLC